MILTEADQFKIAINGAHYCEFRHRIPYEQITHLTIDGDVDIERISIVSTSAPPAQPAYMPSAPAPYPPYGGGGSSFPVAPGGGHPAMPMPPLYPTIVPDQPPSHYPSMPAGPMPTGSSYSHSGPAGPMPGAPSAYPSAYPQAPGPAPAGAGYQGGYPVSLVEVVTSS